MVPGKALERLRSRAGRLDRVSPRAQDGIQQACVRRLVVDDEDPGGHSRAPRPGSEVRLDQERSSRISTGFSRYASNPAARNRSRSSFMAKAVTATMGAAATRRTSQFAQSLDSVHSRQLDIHEHELRAF